MSRGVLRQRREWKRGQAYVLVVTPIANDGRIIGRVTFGGVLRGRSRTRTWATGSTREHQGRGLMTEAVRAATTFAFPPLGSTGCRRR